MATIYIRKASLKLDNLTFEISFCLENLLRVLYTVCMYEQFGFFNFYWTKLLIFLK